MRLNVILQVPCYALVAAGLAWFSTRPAYTHVDPAMALVKISFSHTGARKEDCRTLTPEEIAALSPNMRQAQSCGRERLPLRLELDMDGAPLLHADLPPSGIAGDGAASIYQRFTVAAQSHEFVARLRDSRREQGFDHEGRARITLRARQTLAIDFQPDAGGFQFLAGADTADATEAP